MDTVPRLRKSKWPTKEAVLVAIIWVCCLCPGLLWGREEIKRLREEDEGWR